MGIFSALRPKTQVSAFAGSLVEDIAKRYPPSLDRQPGKRPSTARMTRIIEDACAKAVDFQTQHRLGWFGKAALGNAFRWALREKGYQPDFVELATEALIVLISRPTKPSS